MSGEDAELGIAAVQEKAVGTHGIQEHNKATIAYLNERTLSFILAIAIIGLFVVWNTVTYLYIFYGYLVVVILFILFWGVLRIKRNKQIDEEREGQVNAMKSGK